MILNEPTQTVENVGTGIRIVSNFRITDETMPRLLVDLSDKMYNQKELAVIREYSTNAADAMVKANKSITDIQVTMPTYDNLNFKIRDYGSGLTEEDINNIYCVLGVSTKRNSNQYNGAWGYGCKAGFAHSDSFTVTSWIDGEQSIYQCIKGDTKNPHHVMLLSRTSSDAPSGIEITIPVKQSSMWTFHSVASKFYRYWTVLPTILHLDDDELNKMNIYRSTEPTLKGEQWEVRPSNGSAKGVAYMGYVAYPIDWDVLYNKMSLLQDSRAMFELLRQNNVILFYNIGEITFVNNREGLEYTEDTLKTLINRIESIFSKIKDSIQEKFVNLPNIWEAKKMYNSIFGTGVLELESGENGSDTFERIKILDGNLTKLEQTFNGQFSWNNIVLDGPYFKNINRFDNCRADIGSEYSNPVEPVMLTYRKKKNRVKFNRCVSDKNNGITASASVAIVINDTGNRSGIQQVARYLMLQANSRIKVVHVLKFDNQELKDKFYAEYHFDSVPTLKLSELVPLAKVWNNANKTSRTYKSGGGGGGTRIMQYIDIENSSIEENEVPVREIEDGAYFVNIGSEKNSVLLANGSSYHTANIVSSLKNIVEKLGIEMDRVYIITKQTFNSKWFQSAIKSEDWINVWDFIKDNLSVLDKQTLINADNYIDSMHLSPDVLNKIKPFIFNKDNSLFYDFINKINGLNHSSYKTLIAHLQQCELWFDFVNGVSASFDFALEMDKVNNTYPILDQYNTELRFPTRMEDKVFNNIVQYINAIDLWIDLAPENTKTEEVVDNS